MKTISIWQGPTGFTPGLGYTVFGEAVNVPDELLESLTNQGRITTETPKKKSKKIYNVC